MLNKKKKNNIIFSKEIDASINGYSLVITFILLGIALYMYPQIFGNVNKIVTYIFIFIGFIGFISETDNITKKYNVKGFTDILTGILLAAVLYFLNKYITIPNSWLNIIINGLKIIYIFFWLISIYSISNGILKIVYSLYINIKNNKKKTNIKLLLKLLVDVLGLVLLILQIIKIIEEVSI